MVSHTLENPTAMKHHVFIAGFTALAIAGILLAFTGGLAAEVYQPNSNPPTD